MPDDVITIPADTTQTHTLGTGESLTRTLFDVTEPGAGVAITAHETNWEIRHVSIIGHNDARGFSVADRGGTGARSVIDNVWLGSGGSGIGCYVNPRHSGHLDITRTRVEAYDNGGFHSSAPVGSGGGTVAYERCFAAGNYASNFRTGNDTLDTCTTRANDYIGRGLWAHGDTTATDCNFATGGQNYAVDAGIAGRAVTVDLIGGNYDDGFNGGLNETAGSTITLDGTGTSPSTSVPSGAPLNEGHAYSPDEVRDYEYTPPPEYQMQETDFELVEIGYDEHHEVRLSSGDTLENTVFDLGNARSAVTITAEGGNWAIRDVSFAGVADRPESSPCHAIVASVDSGRSAEIDNVWLGDGSTIGADECGDHGRSAIYVRADHGGDLNISRTSMQGWPGGGVLCSENTAGDIHWQTCFFDRIGHEMAMFPTPTSTADDCVFVNDSGDYT